MLFCAASRRRIWASIAVCALALVTMLPPGVAQQSRGPFSEDEVVKALQGGVPPQRMATLARQYGITFQLTAETEARLRSAGATDALLAALRPLAPVVGSLLIKSNTPGAQVFVDGTLVGITDEKGELQVAQLPPREYRVRLTLAGYQDHKQVINLPAGQPTPVPVTLTKSEPPPPPPLRTFRVTHDHLRGHCSGELIIGNGKLQYRADKGSCSFECPLSKITYGTVRIGGGFYLRPEDGRDRVFRSDSMVAILQLLQQLGSQH